LIFLDTGLSEISGFEICKQIKDNNKTANIPVIFIISNKDNIEQVFESGASDYIFKPFKGKELYMRVNTYFEIKQKSKLIEEQNEKLKLFSQTDELTKLYNRRFMLEKLTEEVERFRRNWLVFSIIICDVNDFKKINDDHGKDCGDFILKEIASILKSELRKIDVLSRWGEKEFLFMLLETKRDGAKRFAERMRKIIEKTIFRYNELNINIKMTFSAVEFADSIDETLKTAEKDLSNGKT
jgi:two-component system, cell cycle response regulator